MFILKMTIALLQESGETKKMIRVGLEPTPLARSGVNAKVKTLTF